MRVRSVVLPKSITKYFWGDNLWELDWARHRDYIVQIVLEKGDREAMKWLMEKVDKKQIRLALPHLKFGAKSKNFWSFYLG